MTLLKIIPNKLSEFSTPKEILQKIQSVKSVKEILTARVRRNRRWYI